MQINISVESNLSINQIGRIRTREINAGLNTIYKIYKNLYISIKEFFEFKLLFVIQRSSNIQNEIKKRLNTNPALKHN
jgi:hypothetical protein